MIGAVDIGGTKIALGLVGDDGRLLAQDQYPTDPAESYGRALDRVAAGLDALVRRFPEPLAGLGIGITGRSEPDGTLHHNDFLPAWSGQNPRRDLAARLGVPAALANDADAAALGEHAWGAGRESRRFIYVTVSTGIGAGLVFDGQLYRGAGGRHPELGHHVIDPSGPPCFCGARGCWEQMASGTALAAWARANGGAPDGDARRVCDLAEAGDPVATAAVRREGRYLGLGLANLILLFAPDCIALGGGLMARWPLFEAAAGEVIRDHGRLVPYQATRLVPATLAHPGLVGAAAVWLYAND